MVTVVNIPATPKSGGGGGGGGLGNMIAALMKKGKEKKDAKDVRSYIDELEKISAAGGTRKDAADIELPGALSRDASGIGAGLQIQNSIFGGKEADKLTAFFTPDGKFVSDNLRSQRPEGTLTLSELATQSTARKGSRLSKDEADNAALYNREVLRREATGAKLDATERRQLRNGIRVWNSNRKSSEDVINRQYGRPDPNDPSRYVYDTQENQKQALDAMEAARSSFLGNLKDPPSLSGALAQGIDTAGKRTERPEPPAQEKPPSALEEFGTFLKGFTGGDTAPKAPEVTLVPFGNIDGQALSIPQGTVQATEIRDYLVDTYKLSPEQASTAIQNYSQPPTPKQ